MLLKLHFLLLTICLIPLSGISRSGAKTSSHPSSGEQSLLGKWDVAVKAGRGEYPSWFEIEQEEGCLKGQFVGKWGAAQPLARIEIRGRFLKFTVDQEPEGWPHPLVFEGRLTGHRLQGTTTFKGELLSWKAQRAPALKRKMPIQWGGSITLFNGKDLTGWKGTPANRKNGWAAVNGVLVNAPPSTNLVTEQTFDDFKLHLEFRIPERSDGGVYLRGRYEIEIEPGFGKPPHSHGIGGIYGFLRPSLNPCKKADEWQTLDAVLIGRRVTVILNGQKIIDGQEIPGITGGALDSHEADPGPIMLQGDHGAVFFRNILLTPAKKTGGA